MVEWFSGGGSAADPAAPASQNQGALYPLYSHVIEEKEQNSLKAGGLESSLQASLRTLVSCACLGQAAE